MSMRQGLRLQVEGGRAEGEGLTIEHTKVVVNGVEYELNEEEVEHLARHRRLDDDGSAVTRADGAPDDVGYTGQTDTYSKKADLGTYYAGEEEEATVHLLAEDAGITASVPYISQYNEDGAISEIERQVVGFDDDGNAYWRDEDGTLKRITQVNYDGDVWPREVIGWTDDGQVISVTRKERATVSTGDGDYVPGAESGSAHQARLAGQVEGGATNNGAAAPVQVEVSTPRVQTALHQRRPTPSITPTTARG